MHSRFLGAACAAAMAVFCAGAAAADTTDAERAWVPRFVLGADYTYTSFSHGGGNTNTWGGSAAGLAPFGGDFSGQLGGAYHSIDFSGGGGGSVSDWNVAGTTSWNPQWGRLGVNVGYTGISGGGASANITNYGVYGQYYPNDQFTLALRGGGFSASANAFGVSGSRNGGYVGGQVKGYVCPKFALDGHVEYDSISQANQTIAGVRGEYLFSQSTPVSIWLGYDYTSFHVTGFSENSNAVSVGLSYYIGGPSGSLMARQRSGVDTFGPSTIDVRF